MITINLKYFLFDKKNFLKIILFELYNYQNEISVEESMGKQETFQF